MSQRSRIKLWILLVLLLVLGVVGSVSYLGWRQSASAPRASVTAPRFLGHKTPFTVTLDAAHGNVVRAEVRVVQNGKAVVVARQDTPMGRHGVIPVTVEAAAAGLREGTATIEVRTQDDFWRPLRLSERAVASIPVTIDLTPPKLEILGATRYVSPGGAAVVAFRVSGADHADVRVGDRTFPSFAYGPPDRGARVAFIALPYDFAGGQLAITAQDEAGNVATRAIPAELKPRRFPHDTIQLKDAFLQDKVAELLPQHPPSQPLIDAFLVVNRDQRRQAEQEKLKVGATTADHPLWEGPFVQPRNTKVFANFAETRTYIYGGRQVDTQVHYGYDLASTKQMPVPAANAGVVAFAGPLTIYGNAVILDHGLGLQTLYGHLSSIEVKAGDKVEKGQEIGRSGTTGLALGDHLHFEVLVSGVSVTPLEWWDAKWIRDRINKPLEEAGLPEIAGIAPGGGGGDERPAGPARRHARRAR